MPLSKLQNFIKNTEGKILYVNPNDIGATDSIENQGNSLSQPFKTVQRALIESARFSYVRGNDNDLFDRTTILLFPGVHFIDNRPGFKIKDDNGIAKAISPAGTETLAQSTLTLSLSSVFDLGVEDNMLYKFNDHRGGVILPRGTAIVGFDLRKTKIKPLYVPNPTDDAAPDTSLIRLTGTCYFRDFTFFDGDLNSQVYTDPQDFSAINKSTPTFSHHKLTCFGFADGVNTIDGTGLTDLDMYYSKLSNAFNEASGRNIDQKFPAEPLGFSKSRVEWEIVGAFQADPISIKTIQSGDGVTPSTLITVETNDPHKLTVGTPVKVRGVTPADYNVSTFVTSVTDETTFGYLLADAEPTLLATGNVSGATVTIETDTVTGASPYVFNVSLRSVFGMNGMLADGATASGFKSMVVAQFTAVSLQKDDRAFVKYNPVSRTYDGISITKVTGSQLATESSSTNSNTVYHLDSRAIYRKGWETSHIKMVNDSIIQVVSVFAIGFNGHFLCESGGDASITNSNSNFGQIALISDGFKAEAFTKDNQGYVTGIIAPQTVPQGESNIDLFTLDVDKTKQVGINSHLYLFGFTDQDNPPAIISQGYRIGARENDKLFVNLTSGAGTTAYSAPILITDNVIGAATTIATGLGSKERITKIVGLDAEGRFSCQVNHNLVTGEKVRIISEDGDLPENLVEDRIYYAITDGINLALFRVASTSSDALRGEAITVYGGTGLRVESRISDKAANEIGCPVLFDTNQNNWFIHCKEDNEIFTEIVARGVTGIGAQTSETFIRRLSDNRSIGDKVYKLRYFIPKESTIGRDPVNGFILQDSNNTSSRNDQDFTISSIDTSDFDFDRNPRYISTCATSGSTVTVRVDKPHDLFVGDVINILDVESTTNAAGVAKSGFNGKFRVTGILDDLTFTHGTTDIDNIGRSTGDFTSDMNTRTQLMARYQRVDNNRNVSLYRSEIIQQHNPGISDGIYHFNILCADNQIIEEFDNLKYLPDIERYYPQLDRDNVLANPDAAKSFAKRSPIGDVAVDDPENSITRESIDKVSRVIGYGRTVVGFERNDDVGIATVTLDRPHGFSGIVTYSSLTGGSGFTEGDYYNVKLLNNGTSDWDGGTARVTVGSGGAVENVQIINPGSGYGAESLDLDGFTGAEIAVTTAGISTFINNSVQLTGIGSTATNAYRVLGTPDKNKVSFAVTAGDPNPVNDQYLVDCGRSVGIKTISAVTANVQTIETFEAHGLVSGGSFNIVDTSNNSFHGFTVLERVGILTFTVDGSNPITQTSPAFLLPTTYDAKGGAIDADTESLGSRVTSIFLHDDAILGNDLGSAEADNKVILQLSNSGIGTAERFPIGSYIQVGSEIMRVSDSNLSGSANNELTVIRGYLASQTATHQEGSRVSRINVRGMELRRPSILRGSGHTFEYLGYGPGNYSTGLPQVQNITLTGREEFLTQSQKRSGGVVVYTAMNNDGDFFIGNKIINPSTGEETTFDAPIPSIRGEDTSVLSVIFDEVTVRQRLLVEGGPSKTLLSQFDGPLRVNNVVNISGNTKVDANLEVTGRFKSSGSADIQGALNVAGVGTFSGKIQGDAGIDAADLSIGVGTSTARIESLNGENLVLKSATTNVMVEDNMDVDGNVTCTRIEADNIIPIGGIIPWSGTSSNYPSTGWLVCDGSSVSQTTYANLYDILTNGGTVFPYGANPSGSTFKLPNLTDRFLVTAGSIYNRGGTGGQKDNSVIDHTHTVTNDPVGAHAHNIGDEPAHTHPSRSANAHDHNVDPVGSHSHTVNPVGNHGHPSRGNNAPHSHTVNPRGGHGHPSRGANAPHSHQVRRFNRGRGQYFQGRSDSRVSNPAFNTLPTTGNNAPHSHTVNPVGNHGHPSRGANAPHSHTVNPGGGHAHPSRSAGGHTHNADPGGAHGHTVNPGGGHDHPVGPNGGHTHPVTADPAGVAGTNRNLPPYFGLFYIIKAL
jgi:microcystin-dependent protein